MGRAEREAAAKRAKQRSGLIRGTIAVVAIVGAIALILTLGGNDKKKTVPTTVAKPAVGTPTACSKATPQRVTTQTYSKAPAMTIDKAKTYTATMATSCGTIVMALDAKEAPNTVNSFVFLARQHFYDGLTFHRVARDFVVQGGDPQGDGSGNPGYSLKTEPPAKGYEAGSVAMANSGPDTTGSQFFLTWSADGAKKLGGPPYLYSILGKVTKGLDVVKAMGGFAPKEGNGDGRPTQPLYIVNVTISES
jgi:cyclophilin family peptidyl-prolyl cis-trans isomerase